MMKLLTTLLVLSVSMVGCCSARRGGAALVGWVSHQDMSLPTRPVVVTSALDTDIRLTPLTIEGTAVAAAPGSEAFVMLDFGASSTRGRFVALHLYDPDYMTELSVSPSGKYLWLATRNPDESPRNLDKSYVYRVDIDTKTTERFPTNRGIMSGDAVSDYLFVGVDYEGMIELVNASSVGSSPTVISPPRGCSVPDFLTANPVTGQILVGCEGSMFTTRDVQSIPRATKSIFLIHELTKGLAHGDVIYALTPKTLTVYNETSRAFKDLVDFRKPGNYHESYLLDFAKAF